MAAAHDAPVLWRPSRTVVPVIRRPSLPSGTWPARLYWGRAASGPARPGSSSSRGAHGTKLARPFLPAPARYQRGRAEVLGLMPEGAGLAALVGLAPTGTKEAGAKEGGAKDGGTATTLDPGFVVAWASTSGIWRTSPAYSLGTGHHLASFGATPAGGVFVLGQGPSGGMDLAVAGGPGLSWRDLPAPPNSTATVAFLPGGTVDALAVKEHHFDCLGTVSGHYHLGQGPGAGRPRPVRVFELMAPSHRPRRP